MKHACIMILGITFILAACAGGAKNTQQPVPDNNQAQQPAPNTLPPAAEPALPLDADGVQLVARINGVGITLPHFERMLNRSHYITDMNGYDTAVNAVLDLFIEQVIINEQSALLNIAITDDEVEEQYQEMRAMLPNDAAWQQWLADNLFTEAEFRESLRASLLTQQLQKHIVDTATLMIPTLHARHILVDDETTAHTVLARLDAGGDFAQLASEFSKDPNTFNTGGDLGWFVRDDLTVPELADFAMGLQPGQHGGPFQTVLGYHIIETLASGQRPATPEEQYELGMIQFNTWMVAQRENVVVERYID